MTDSPIGSEEPRSRAGYLLDDRRVTIADLLGCGLLKEGGRLRFVRLRIGESHEAAVTPRGLHVQAGSCGRSTCPPTSLRLGPVWSCDLVGFPAWEGRGPLG